MRRQRNRCGRPLVLVGDGLRLPVEARALRVAPGALVAVLQGTKTFGAHFAAADSFRLAHEAKEAATLPRLGNLVLAAAVLEPLHDRRDRRAVLGELPLETID